jgi:hypothetical protein
MGKSGWFLVNHPTRIYFAPSLFLFRFLISYLALITIAVSAVNISKAIAWEKFSSTCLISYGLFPYLRFVIRRNTKWWNLKKKLIQRIKKR